MKSINFRRHDGLCPYFKYRDTTFFIQDSRRDGVCKGPWQFTLFKRIEFRKVKKSIDPSKAISRFLRDKKYRMECDNYIYQGMRIGIRQSEGKIIIVPEKHKEIEGPFSSYDDCLNFSKDYVQEYIKNYEKKHLNNQVSFMEVS